MALDQFMEITNQLLQDVAERLVFRANVFFQHDLNAYVPSPGDLAYPEKLEHMEVILMLHFLSYNFSMLFTSECSGGNFRKKAEFEELGVVAGIPRSGQHQQQLPKPVSILYRK